MREGWWILGCRGKACGATQNYSWHGDFPGAYDIDRQRGNVLGHMIEIGGVEISLGHMI